MRRAAAGIGVTALLVVAGCGGDGGGVRLSKEDFIAKADAICKEFDEKVELVEFPAVDPTSAETSDEDLEKLGDALDEGLVLFRGQIDELRDLEPPEDFEEEFAQAIGDLEASADAIEDAADAAKDGDREAIAAAFARAEEAGDRTDRIARDYGLEVCGAED